jgi:hypothetical protein
MQLRLADIYCDDIFCSKSEQGKGKVARTCDAEDISIFHIDDVMP